MLYRHICIIAELFSDKEKENEDIHGVLTSTKTNEDYFFV